MALFLLWWTFDDHLAAALETPGLGELPWWVVLLMGLALSWTTEAHVVRKVEKSRK